MKRDQSEEPVDPTSTNHHPAWNALPVTFPPPLHLSFLCPRKQTQTHTHSRTHPNATVPPSHPLHSSPPPLTSPLPRHRAINLFIPAYERLWIEAEEYSFEEKLVQDLAVSTGPALPPRRVPCVGAPLPVLSAESFFGSEPVESWERARAGSRLGAAGGGGPRCRHAKPLRQRSVRSQRLHDHLRRRRASCGAPSFRKAGFAILTVVRRDFTASSSVSLAVWDPDPTHQLSFRCTL